MTKKHLTDKQQNFLGHLVEVGGDPKKAAELAGYSGNHWQVTKSLKNEIIDLASNILAQSAPQAALKLTGQNKFFSHVKQLYDFKQHKQY